MTLITGGTAILLLYLLNRVWWRIRPVRVAALTLPIVGVLSIILWGIGIYNSIDWLILPTAAVGALAFILEVALMISLPFSGVIHLIDHLFDRWSRKAAGTARKEQVDQRRRLILRAVAAAVPLTSVGAAAAGTTRAMRSARVYAKPISITNLPNELNGLKIFHLSDLHLGMWIRTGNLEDVLEQAETYEPDIVLVTGDIADDLNLLSTALRLIDELRAPLGAYACLGNHEHYRGIGQVQRIFDSSPVPLLIDQAVRFDRNGQVLAVGAIDDPRSMGADHTAFYRSSIEGIMSQTRTGDSVILMSHRPDGFVPASDAGVMLTLSGHTHGGQIGWGERSIFESGFPEAYLWGHYQREQSHLYTSAGMGHWFPFRLGCPPEAPVIELVGA